MNLCEIFGGGTGKKNISFGHDSGPRTSKLLSILFTVT